MLQITGEWNLIDFVIIEKSGIPKFHKYLKSADIEFEMDEKI